MEPVKFQLNSERLGAVSKIGVLVLMAVLCASGAQLERTIDIEDLIDQLRSDFHTDETLKELNQMLVQPGITPALVARFQQDFAKGNRQNTECMTALGALRYRKDIPPEALTPITLELERSSNQIPPLSSFDEQFARVGLPILKHYPSAYHEELALKFVRLHVGHVLRSAVAALRDIGSLRSISELKTTREKIAKQYPGSESIVLIDEALAEIQKRRLQYPDMPHLETIQGRVDDTESSTKTAPEGFKGSTAVGWVIALILLSLGAGVWFRRRSLRT